MEMRFRNLINYFSRCIGTNCSVQLKDGFYNTSAGIQKRGIRVLEILSDLNSVKFTLFKFKEDTRKNKHYGVFARKVQKHLLWLVRFHINVDGEQELRIDYI